MFKEKTTPKEKTTSPEISICLAQVPNIPTEVNTAGCIEQNVALKDTSVKEYFRENIQPGRPDNPDLEQTLSLSNILVDNPLTK